MLAFILWSMGETQVTRERDPEQQGERVKRGEQPQRLVGMCSPTEVWVVSLE